MVDASTCELSACGVLATGRCRRCGRAYCGTHQALGMPWDQRALSEFNLPADAACRECVLPAMEDMRRAEDEADRQKTARAAGLASLAKAALAALNKAGRPGLVRVDYTGQRWHKRLFRKAGFVTYTVHLGYGYPLGKITAVDVGGPHSDAHPTTVDLYLSPDGEPVLSPPSSFGKYIITGNYDQALVDFARKHNALRPEVQGG